MVKVLKVTTGLLLVAGLLDHVRLAEAGFTSNRRTKADREWKLRKKQCETRECLQLPVHERSNCVNECTSSSCFKEVYAAEPLEPGEVDRDRQRRFLNCCRREARMKRFAHQKGTRGGAGGPVPEQEVEEGGDEEEEEETEEAPVEALSEA